MKLSRSQKIIIALFLLTVTFGEGLFGTWTMAIGLGFDIGRKVWIGSLVLLFISFWLFMTKKKHEAVEQSPPPSDASTTSPNAAEDAATAMMESAAKKAKSRANDEANKSWWSAAATNPKRYITLHNLFIIRLSNQVVGIFFSSERTIFKVRFKALAY